jgi:cytochrome P450
LSKLDHIHHQPCNKKTKRKKKGGKERKKERKKKKKKGKMTLGYGKLVVGFLAIYVIITVAQSLQRAIQRRKFKRAHDCKPPPRLDSGFMGIKRYLEIRRKIKKRTTFKDAQKNFNETGTTLSQVVLGASIVSTIEPENVKAVLSTKFTDFSLGLRHNSFFPLLGDGIFTLDGEGWSHSRAMLRPQFSREQVADVAMLGEHVNSFIAHLPQDKMAAFDIQEMFFNLTLDTATEFLFGESVHSLAPGQIATEGPLAACGGNKGFAYAFNKSQVYILERANLTSFYWLVNPPEFRKLVKQVHSVVEYYVDRAVAAVKADPLSTAEKSDSGRRYVFLEALARETQDKKALRDQMLNILLAGRDTTGSLLSSSFFYLARHPQVLLKLRQQILDQFPNGTPTAAITLERLREIKYLRYFLNEVLRLFPPVPSNSRLAVNDTVLPVGGGPDGKSPTFVAKGSRVSYMTFVMHRRQDYYGPDAELFRPERWEENGKRGWEYLPFNGGPRICLGQQYALAEASYVLVRLLMIFDTIENAQPEIQDPIPSLGLTMAHEKGVKVRLYNSSSS